MNHNDIRIIKKVNLESVSFVYWPLTKHTTLEYAMVIQDEVPASTEMV